MPFKKTPSITALLMREFLHNHIPASPGATSAQKANDFKPVAAFSRDTAAYNGVRLLSTLRKDYLMQRFHRKGDDEFEQRLLESVQVEAATMIMPQLNKDSTEDYK